MKFIPPKENQKKGSLSDDVQTDLRRRNICFTCQEPWAPGHWCVVGKAHYIEVFYDSGEEEQEDTEGDNIILIAGEDTPPP